MKLFENINIKKGLKRLSVAVAVAMMTMSATLSLAAESLQDTKLVTGTKKLLEDASKALLIIAPCVGGACVIYFMVRKAHSDEQDQKMWKNRAVNAIICTVVAMAISSLLNVLTSYYQ